MLQQIILHTPLWVWAILAFLVYRGLIASVDRETSLKKVFIIPIVMLALSLQGIVSSFGSSEMALASWVVFVLAGSFLSWSLFDQAGISADPQRGVVLQKGSWIPMMLMMGIFCTKYVVGVTLAMNAGLRQEMLFVTGVSALFGLFSGIFIGKLLRILAAYRDASGFNSPAGNPALVK